MAELLRKPSINGCKFSLDTHLISGELNRFDKDLADGRYGVLNGLSNPADSPGDLVGSQTRLKGHALNQHNFLRPHLKGERL